MRLLVLAFVIVGLLVLSGSLPGTAGGHLQGPGKELLTANKFSLGYLPYDWSLNEQGAKQ